MLNLKKKNIGQIDKSIYIERDMNKNLQSCYQIGEVSLAKKVFSLHAHTPQL